VSKTNELAFPKKQKRKPKETRTKSSAKRVRASVKARQCSACGKTPADCHHLIHRAVGGPDIEANLVPLCRFHHTEIHAYGITRFVEAYPSVKAEMILKGWVYDDYRKKWTLNLKELKNE
jgi:hypothetical protein